MINITNEPTTQAWSSDVITCPYCLKKERDTWEYFNAYEEYVTIECPHCEETFTCTKYVSESFTSRKLK